MLQYEPAHTLTLSRAECSHRVQDVHVDSLAECHNVPYSNLEDMSCVGETPVELKFHQSFSMIDLFKVKPQQQSKSSSLPTPITGSNGSSTLPYT